MAVRPGGSLCPTPYWRHYEDPASSPDHPPLRSASVMTHAGIIPGMRRRSCRRPCTGPSPCIGIRAPGRRCLPGGWSQSRSLSRAASSARRWRKRWRGAWPGSGHERRGTPNPTPSPCVAVGCPRSLVARIRERLVTVTAMALIEATIASAMATGSCLGSCRQGPRLSASGSASRYPQVLHPEGPVHGRLDRQLGRLRKPGNGCPVMRG